MTALLGVEARCTQHKSVNDSEYCFTPKGRGAMAPDMSARLSRDPCELDEGELSPVLAAALPGTAATVTARAAVPAAEVEGSADGLLNGSSVSESEQSLKENRAPAAVPSAACAQVPVGESKDETARSGLEKNEGLAHSLRTHILPLPTAASGTCIGRPSGESKSDGDRSQVSPPSVTSAAEAHLEAPRNPEGALYSDSTVGALQQTQKQGQQRQQQPEEITKNKKHLLLNLQKAHQV